MPIGLPGLGPSVWGWGATSDPMVKCRVGISEQPTLRSHSRLEAESCGGICFSGRFWAADAGPGLGERGWSSPPSPETGVALPQVPVQTS